LAALLNAIFLLVASGGIGWEAIQRFRQPNSVPGGIIIAVAVVGIAITIGSALMFLSGRKHDLHIRGAFLHLVADAAVSLGIVLAGVAILTTGWLWFDPAVGLIITIVIVVGTWQLLLESLNLIMDAVPAGIEPLTIRAYLAQLPGVAEVHDLHIWGISTTEIALTAHLITPGGHPGDQLMAQIAKELHDRFGIEHPTIQIELGKSANFCNVCVLAPDSHVGSISATGHSQHT